jgi:hypothetical protein
MRPYRSRVSKAVVAALLTAACNEDTPTAAPEVLSDLALAVPSDLADRLVVRTVSERGSPGGGPARSEHLGYGSYDWPPDENPDVAAAIWNERTRANFVPGALSVIGSHNFQGNKGSIETDATVNYQGVTVGTQRSIGQEVYPFLLDALREHYIWTEARIFTDRECGLTGFGSSRHSASWEAVFAGPVFNFSEIIRSTTSEYERQPDCDAPPPPPPPTAGTGSSFTSGGGGEAVCYFWLTYYIDTSDIIEAELLFCTEGG